MTDDKIVTEIEAEMDKKYAQLRDKIDKSIKENEELYEVLKKNKVDKRIAWSSKLPEEKMEELYDMLDSQEIILQGDTYKISVQQACQIIREFGAIRNRLGIVEGKVSLLSKALGNVAGG